MKTEAWVALAAAIWIGGAMWVVREKDARIAADQDVIMAVLETQACYIADQMSDGSPADCRDKWEKQRLAFEAWDKVEK